MEVQSIMIIIALVSLTSAFAHQDACNLKQTCRACIQEPQCTWCSDPSWNGTKPRCSKQKQNCSENFIINPVTNFTDLVNKPLVSYTNNMSEVIQVAPQEIKLNMRINEPVNITLKYARAEYPVDLYYLMDLSNSMKDDKETLESLGKSLEDLMRNITSDFRLGFGSFVDKIVAPYTNTLPLKMQEPCKGCTSPYGFHNHMRLSNNVTNFPLEVGHAIISGNVDDLEGGFDALMQAVVCWEEIGWRDNARRLLVFSTDSGFHMAGDGKLGGIVEPNDGKCHLDKNGIYTHSILQDYPSVSHLNHQIGVKSINVIFAVTEPQVQAYKYLTKNIEGAQAGSLTADSSNILELVEEQYKKISSSVEMKHNAPEYIQVLFYTSCKSSSKIIKQSTKCDELKIGDEVEFRVEINVLSCPKDTSEWNKTFRIYPVGSHEAIVVHLQMNCDCSCEQKEHQLYKENAPECSNNGTYMCGICSCNSMRFGQKCECSSSELISTDTNIPSDCKPSKDSKVPECSGRGVCFCGVCNCDKRDNANENIYGKYCECDNFSCDRANGLLCAGHGVCECGKCHCNAEWSGDDCNCLISEENCKADEKSEMCSNQGDCECGACQCSEGYEGDFCEQFIPPVAQRTECENLFPCVLCLVHQKGPLNPEQCADNCTSIIIDEVDAIEENVIGSVNCVQYDENNCRCEYQYFYNESSVLIIKALKNLDCPLQYGFYSILGAIILFIFGLIAIALWKFITVRNDKREVMKFIREQERAKWDSGANPLYRKPVSTFRNPTYDALS